MPLTASVGVLCRLVLEPDEHVSAGEVDAEQGGLAGEALGVTPAQELGEEVLLVASLTLELQQLGELLHRQGDRGELDQVPLGRSDVLADGDHTEVAGDLTMDGQAAEQMTACQPARRVRVEHETRVVPGEAAHRFEEPALGEQRDRDARRRRAVEARRAGPRRYDEVAVVEDHRLAHELAELLQHRLGVATVEQGVEHLPSDTQQ